MKSLSVTLFACTDLSSESSKWKKKKKVTLVTSHFYGSKTKKGLDHFEKVDFMWKITLINVNK